MLSDRIQDLGARRIADMDSTGIDMQILSITCPGVQMFDPDEGAALAIAANDQLAEAIKAHPHRFAGLTAIAPQNPAAAAREIERGVKTLGLRGVIINSHTQHQYLDDPNFWPIFEAADALEVPIHLHPNTPSKQLIPAFLDRGLDGAVLA